MAMVSSAPQLRARGTGDVLVVVGPGAEDHELDRARHGEGWSVHDALGEDPFASAEELAAVVTGQPPRIVVCLGARTLTAEAVALIHDAPLATTRTLTPTRLSSLDAATTSGSEMRSAALEVRVDGRRRFATEHIEITGRDLAVEGITSASPGWSRRRVPLRIGPQGVGSDVVRVHDFGAGHADGMSLRLTAGEGRVAIRGRDQRFDLLEITVHPSPFRQIVAGTASRRRPIVDTAPL